MAFAATREVKTPTRRGLLSEGWDFGFGIGGFLEGGFDWGTFGGLFPPIRDILRESAPPVVPVVISEIPQTWEDLEELDPELFEPILETRPGRTPDPYPGSDAAAVVIGDPYAGDTPAQDDVGEETVAHDWGHLIRQGAEAVFGLGGGAVTPQAYVGSGAAGTIGGTTEAVLAAGGASGGGVAGCDGMTWAGGAPPKGYKVVRDSCGNGVLRKVRRRRRRRMLTNGDKDDIASIVSMVGKGQMAAALINGSMRRG